MMEIVYHRIFLRSETSHLTVMLRNHLPLLLLAWTLLELITESMSLMSPTLASLHWLL